MSALRIAAVALGLAGVAVGVDAAARSDVLEIAAVPLALALVAFFRLLGPRAEHRAWAVFLGCLGLTYVDPAGGALARELAALAACVALAVAGVWTSPWLIAMGFAAHVGWDFVPRDLPPHLRGLPLACLLFDGAVAGYVGWQAAIGRWNAAGRESRGLR